MSQSPNAPAPAPREVALIADAIQEQITEGTRRFYASDVAERSGIAKSYLKKLEDGEVQNPTIGALASVCLAMGHPLEVARDYLATTKDGSLDDVIAIFYIALYG